MDERLPCAFIGRPMVDHGLIMDRLWFTWVAHNRTMDQIRMTNVKRRLIMIYRRSTMAIPWSTMC